MLVSNRAAILKANGKLGSYFPVSMALMVWRETSSRRARSACDQSRSARLTLSLFSPLWVERSEACADGAGRRL